MIGEYVKLVEASADNKKARDLITVLIREYERGVKTAKTEVEKDLLQTAIGNFKKILDYSI